MKDFTVNLISFDACKKYIQCSGFEYYFELLNVPVDCSCIIRSELYLKMNSDSNFCLSSYTSNYFC